MKRLARIAILRLLFLLGLRHVMRRFYRDRVIILMYHGFCRKADELGLLNAEGNHVEEESFRRQLAYLSRFHSILSLERYVSIRHNGEPLPRYPVIITMDDGYKTNYSLAFPLLKEYKAAASVFVTTGFVNGEQLLWTDRLALAISNAPAGTYQVGVAGRQSFELNDSTSRQSAALRLIQHLKNIPQDSRDSFLRALEAHLVSDHEGTSTIPEIFEPLSWGNIEEMTKSGLVTCGNHTHTHVVLSRSEPSSQQTEIRSAHVLIEQHTNVPCRSFCYPNGGREDYDELTKSILLELGYQCALTTEPGYNDATTPLFDLRRVAVNSRATFDDFMTILYGGWRGLARDLRRGRSQIVEV